MIINFDEHFDKLGAFLSAREEQLKNESWRCVYLNLSTVLEEEDRTSFATKKTGLLLEESLETEDGNLFFFPDGDVFIFFQGRTHALVEKIPEVIGALLDEDVSQHIKIYDLTRDMHSIKVFYEKKVISNKTRIAREAEEKSKELKADPTLVASIDQTRRSNPPQVLVIEDDTFVRRMIRNVLHKQYQVIEAGTGVDGVNAYFASAPDVVFLDIEMPEHNGLEVLEFICKHDPSAFVAMLTSSTIKGNIKQALTMGAKGFIAKPFSRNRLTQFIDECPTIQAKKA